MNEYFAGFFDGEGCISFDGRGYRVSVGQNMLEPLLLFEQTFGGHVYAYKQGKSYLWKLSSQPKVLQCLETLLPSLIVKRDKALQAISFLSSKSLISGRYAESTHPNHTILQVTPKKIIPVREDENQVEKEFSSREDRLT
jgi:hypothetical protein